MQRDKYISRVLWAYHNTPYSITGEDMPSFYCLDFIVDIRTTEAALLPAKSLRATNTSVSDYQEQMVLSLSSIKNMTIKTKQQQIQSLELAIEY